MIARCPECNSKGTLRDELAGRQVSCPRCGAKFVAEAVLQKKWYYAVGDTRIGPIKQEQFARLIADGTIAPDTMVWRKGLTGWHPLSEVRPTTASNKCATCHGNFSPALLREHDGVRVCESCQLRLLRPETDREPTTPEAALKYGSRVGRLVGKIIDLIFMLALAGMVEGLSRTLFPGGYAENTITPVFLATLIINMLIGIIYVTWFVGKFGATPGKMVVKLKITNSNGGKIGYAHAFGRYCAEYIVLLGLMSGMTLFFFWAISSLFPLNQVMVSAAGAVFATFALVYAPALFDRQRRTLYDRLANTRVLAA